MKRLVISTIAVLIFTAPSMATVWTVPGDFGSIQEAIDDPNVVDGDRILVGPGDYSGALITKSVEIRGIGGASIVDGPVHGSGLIQGFRLLAGSDGATISHLTFTEDVDLAIMNGAAVNDVTVEHCTFEKSIQAISNWVGSGWIISHNKIVDLRSRCGGGIGILIADYTGSTVTNNIVSHNTIKGTLYVDPNDCGGYNGSGIVLYADFRWNREGAENISHTRVVKNKVALTSDTPNVVDVAAIELTDIRNDGSLDPVILNNAVGFNDLRGTVLTIVLTPENLADVNDISRNLGHDKNRGHGLHPRLFGPGGH